MAKRKIEYSDLEKEELIAVLTELKKRKKYGLVWDEEREPEKVVQDCKKQLPVLKEVTGNSIRNNPLMPNHFLIEGDNYHALSVLNYTHLNAIDLIFIDPPYNKGGDFIYNDKYVDKEDSYRHSKWLTFMKKRLELARNVLKETGVIFITIDDNEASHLRVLCDEIFQPNNFIAQICWQKKFSPQNDAKYFSDMHDFILVYAKKKKSGGNSNIGFTLLGLDRTVEMNARYSNPDNDPRGNWTSSDLTAKRVTPKDIYAITTPTGKKIMPVKGRSWSVSRKRLKELLSENRIWFGEDGNNMPRLKRFLSDIQEKVTPVTWWPHTEVGHNQEAKQELKKILHDTENVFDTPKPVRLIKRIIQLTTQPNNNSIILDFFAGSGTTAQAVIEMNDNDGGNRQSIMATNNENNICVDSTYPRIKRVIEGYKFEGNEKKVIFEEKLNLLKLRRANEIYADYSEARDNNVDQFDELKGEFKENTLKLFGIRKYDGWKNGLGGNLKYYRTAFVPAKSTDRNKEILTKQSVEMLCLKEDTFELVSETDILKIFKNNTQYTCILFDEQQIPELKEQIKELDLPISIYIFSLGDDDFAEEFIEMQDKVKVRSIPAAILKVYKRIFK